MRVSLRHDDGNGLFLWTVGCFGTFVVSYSRPLAVHRDVFHYSVERIRFYTHNFTIRIRV